MSVVLQSWWTLNYNRFCLAIKTCLNLSYKERPIPIEYIPRVTFAENTVCKGTGGGEFLKVPRNLDEQPTVWFLHAVHCKEQ